MSKDSSCNFSTIADFLGTAKDEKVGIYSVEPQVTSHQLVKEVNAAEAYLSHVFD
jgi:hypothetical protein